MTNIVHLIDNAGVGGAQSMLFELYYAFNKYYSNYEQLVISMDNRPADKEFISSYGILYRSIRDNKQVVANIKSLKNPVVLYHKLASSSLNILKSLKKKKIPIIAINHTLYNSRAWKDADSSCCDIMVAVSDHMEKNIRKWYPKIKKYTYIHNGVNHDRYKPIKSSKKNSGILTTGRINRVCGWKHSEKFVRWVKDVNLPIPMIHDYIGGRIGSRGGSSKKNKVRIIKGKRNIVNMLGNISNFKEKVSIIKSWDLFLYETNREEGISMAILEALASGVPVICSNHFGNKEIIEQGVNGFVFRDRNEAKAILKDLCKHKDKLNSLKKSALNHFIENLDAKHTARKYIKLIEKLQKNEIEDSVPELIINTKKEEKVKEDISKKFTIISSCYNKAKYLQDWINSILAQKYRPLEVIIANDASTDKSLKILKRNSEQFKEKGIEFKIINNFNRMYCGDSYKNIVNYITGSYVGVVDSDDALVDDAVEYIMNIYNKHVDIAWIYTQFEICDMEMKTKRRGFCRAPDKGESLIDLGRKRIHGYGHWRTFNRKIITRPEKLYGKELKCGVDKYMGYRLEEMGPGMFADRVCYRYRQHPVGSIESVSSTKEAIKVWKNIIYEIVKRRNKYKRKAYPIIKYIGEK